jgi:hypothetical protein
MANLTLELDTETSLVPHGKVLSAPITGHLTMPNLPNPMCPVSGVQSKNSYRKITTQFKKGFNELFFIWTITKRAAGD